MKKALPWIIVAVIILAVFLWVKNSYNSIVTADEAASGAWSQVENQYQRRLDLIPNLVATVKGYAEYESSTLQEVVEARAKATQVTVDPQKLYPDLKANQQFLDLQAQLEGTENRIAVARKDFNDVVKGYNTMIRRFPSNIIANIFGFDAKGYFESVDGAEVAPQVQF